jgi:hypothetical protein
MLQVPLPAAPEEYEREVVPQLLNGMAVRFRAANSKRRMSLMGREMTVVHRVIASSPVNDN